MKARWLMRCECCKTPIYVGSQFSMYASRPWITAHLIRYKESRRVFAK